eukprot:1177612-Prorocentrum_minimum.AAC.1
MVRRCWVFFHDFYVPSPSVHVGLLTHMYHFLQHEREFWARSLQLLFGIETHIDVVQAEGIELKPAVEADGDLGLLGASTSRLPSRLPV